MIDFLIDVVVLSILFGLFYPVIQGYRDSKIGLRIRNATTRFLNSLGEVKHDN